MDPKRNFRRGPGNRYNKSRRTLPKGVHRDHPGSVQQLHGIRAFATGISISTSRNIEDLMPAPAPRRKHINTSNFCPTTVAARRAGVLADHAANPNTSIRVIAARHGYSPSAVYRLLRRPVTKVVEVNPVEKEIAELRAKMEALEEAAQINYGW